MSNVINIGDYRAPVRLPAELLAAKTWLVWRLVQIPGEKKPKKIPYYIDGRAREGDHGSEADLQALVSFDRAVAAVSRGRWTGVGLAMVRSNGLVALDFDDCVDAQGNIDPQVLPLIAGTYSEFSPSGKGVRAFYSGNVRDRKDNKRKPEIEFFCGSGYVTVTGNVTPECEMWGNETSIAPMTPEVLAFYRSRFGDETGQAGGDDWLLTVAPKIGLFIEKARAMVMALDEDCSYDEWANAGMALHHEFDGSIEAREVWKEWSRKSSEKYPGDREIDKKWESFGDYRGAPITAAYLLKHSKVARVVARYEALGDWKTQVLDAPDEYDLREKVCPAIARDERLDDIDRESLAQMLVDRFKRFGTKLPIAAVRKMVAPPESLLPTVHSKRPLTEFGNAERMLDMFGHGLMYVPELKSWHCWTGIYWRKASDIEIEHMAKETVRALVKEADEHQDAGEFFAFCAISQQARMVRNMVALAASDPRVMTPAAELDKHRGMLCVMNGVIDLRSGRLMKPDPEMRLTKSMGANYVPGARAPLWEQTLLDVFEGDAEMVAYLQRVIGYAAVGEPQEDIMVIPHGNGANGKSTVFGTLRKVFGGYARSADASSFLQDARGGGGSAGGPREDLLRLRGARFVYANEPDENSELREGTVKAMTGGDAILARGLWATESVEIVPSWVVFMPTNHKPIVKGGDNGIWRRLVLLPFNRNFESDPTLVKDEKREEKLEAEAEGILAWIVEGAQMYLTGGLQHPKAVREAREAYRSQMDLLSEWLDECCELGDEFSVPSKALWQSWESYAKTNGILNYVRSSVALGRRLDQRFPSFKGSGGIRMRRGLRLTVADFDANGQGSDDFFA